MPATASSMIALQVGELLGADRLDEVVLVVEVPVDRRWRDAHGVGHGSDRDRVLGARLEQESRRLPTGSRPSVGRPRRAATVLGGGAVPSSVMAPVDHHRGFPTTPARARRGSHRGRSPRHAARPARRGRRDSLTPMRACSRRKRRGCPPVPRPASRMKAGTSVPRMRKASISTASVRPTPNSLMKLTRLRWRRR